MYIEMNSEVRPPTNDLRAVSYLSNFIYGLYANKSPALMYLVIVYVNDYDIAFNYNFYCDLLMT